MTLGAVKTPRQAVTLATRSSTERVVVAPHGGPLEHCSGADQAFSSKIPCAQCCAGMHPIAFGSALLVVWNDLWLKRQHPGVWSGKLSDVGLCIFLPLFLAAALQYGAAGWALVTRRPRAAWRLDIAACVIAASYFTAIKIWPAATHAHVAWLTAVVPHAKFRAITDPTDLLCLPAIAVAWWTLRRDRQPCRRALRSAGL